MKRKLWKQMIGLVLAVVIMGMAAVPVQAEETTESTNKGRNIYLNQLLNSEFEYDITEEEVAAFEQEYEEGFGQTVRPQSTGSETVAEFAQKKATVLTALYGLESIQYALIEDGEITVTGTSGYADKIAKKAADGSTMYGIGSVSKIFTTTAVLQLVEEGKVNLDEPVTTYIPEFTMKDERYKEITVRMLLNHSSGILGSSFGNAILFADNDTINHDTFLELLKTQRLKADPGDFSVYCNDGFTLAEILVERVSGLSFTEYIAENITVPLGMWGTKTPQDTFKKKKLAGSYSDKLKLPAENFNQIGTGGMYSTAENLCYLAEIFMEDSEWDNVLSKQSAAMTMELAKQGSNWQALSNKTDGYGLGWDSVNAYPFNQYGIKALVKGGDSIYYHGSLIVLPGENKAVAVLSSSGSSTVDQIFASGILLQALYADGSITDLEYTASYEKPIKQTIPSDITQYEGYYVSLLDILKVEMDQEGSMTLSSIFNEKNSVKLVYTGNGKFRTTTGTNEYWFVKEGNGEVYLRGGTYASLPGIGTYFGEYYQGQKIESNPLSEKVALAWENRKDKVYFIINEKYTSVNYLSTGLFANLVFPEELEGYMAYSKIIDENTAITDMAIPEMAGRDLQDYKFYTKKGIEYVAINDYIAISEDDVEKLPVKSKYTLTIGKDGYAKWYKVSKKAAGKVMKVTVPENASFAVYDKDGKCELYSYVSEKTKIKLPKGGYVVFAGDAKADFTVKLKGLN